MEPFAIVNLLKSLLENTQKKEDAPPTQEKPSPAPTEPKPPKTEEEAPINNPYLSFMDAHDARARKLRK